MPNARAAPRQPAPPPSPTYTVRDFAGMQPNRDVHDVDPGKSVHQVNCGWGPQGELRVRGGAQVVRFGG